LFCELIVNSLDVDKANFLTSVELPKYDAKVVNPETVVQVETIVAEDKFILANSQVEDTEGVQPILYHSL